MLRSFGIPDSCRLRIERRAALLPAERRRARADGAGYNPLLLGPALIASIVMEAGCGNGGTSTALTSTASTSEDTDAVKLYRASADDNDPAAQYELAMQATSRDDQRYWFCRSASQPHALQGGALYQLGRLYQSKYGDPVEAHRWYSAAAAHDNAFAIRQLEEMEKTMTIEQIEEADRRAAAWKPGDCGSAPPRAATPVRPHSIERRA